MNQSQEIRAEQGVGDLGALVGVKEKAGWNFLLYLDKYEGDELVESLRREGNLLMYGGASLLWEAVLGNGTNTAGQALTWLNNANAAIGVGDSSTAEAATQTDMQAAVNKLRKAMDATFPSHADGTTGAAITAASNASPIQITSNGHGRATGDYVNIAGVGGNTAANGSWRITVVDANNFTLDGSTGNGAYTSGGLWTRANLIAFRSTFGQSEANFAWNEFGIFNSASAGVGRMLNRKVQSLGTKTSAASWVLTVLVWLA